jgi:hypothetical protein
MSELKAGDAKAIRRAVKLRVKDGVLEEISMSIADDQMDALLARLITMWSFTHGHPMANPAALDELSLEDYNELVQVAQPYKDAVDNAGKSSKPNGKDSVSSSEPATPQTSVQPSPSNT